LIAAGLFLAVVLGVAGITLEWRRAEANARGELKQRRIAEKDAAETRANLYAADLAVASQALQNGDLGRARRVLSALQPEPGETDLRGFAWRYLWHQCCGDQLAVLPGHEATVNCAAFSPSGKWLASGSQDGTVRIWDVARRQLKICLSVTPGGLNDVTFTTDDKFLITGSDRGVALWDTGSGQVHSRFPGQLAALAKTGGLLATAAASPFFSDPPGVVRLWNWRTGQMLYQFKEPGRALALSADGKLLAVAEAETGIIIWDTDTHQPIRRLTTREPVWALDFSPDGRRLVSAGWSSEVSIYEVWTNAPPALLSGHLLHVWSAVFSPDGQTIVSASSDQTVRLWDALTLQQKRILRGHASEVWCAAVSPDGRLIATGGKDNQVMLWAAAVGTENRTVLPHDMDFRPLFSPDGKRLVTVNPEDGRSQLWNTADGSLAVANLVGGRQVIGFSPDSACVATFDAANLKLDYWWPEENVLQREKALESRQPGLTGFAYAGMSPAQDYFFAIGTNGLIQVWNAGTGRISATMQGPVPPIRNAVLSPLGESLVVCTDYEKVARLYNCTTGMERLLAGHQDFVSGLAFSPDGLTLATGSMDGTIRLWETSSGQTTMRLAGHMQETTDVAFSPDGLTLASLGRNESMKLWDLRTGREVVTEGEPRAGIWLQFCPDGKRLAVETDSDQIRLLEAPY
jgi:WD40 repeat protein